MGPTTAQDRGFSQWARGIFFGWGETVWWALGGEGVKFSTYKTNPTLSGMPIHLGAHSQSRKVKTLTSRGLHREKPPKNQPKFAKELLSWKFSLSPFGHRPQCVQHIDLHGSSREKAGKSKARCASQLRWFSPAKTQMAGWAKPIHPSTFGEGRSNFRRFQLGAE